jgi:GNAT superfamily N-acetyltransferase
MSDLGRSALRTLLDERQPADAAEAYYAFYHPVLRTTLVLEPADTLRPAGYVALSQTGMDLFRPLVTMRLPLDDPEAARRLLQRALPPVAPLIVQAPAAYRPLLGAFLDIQTEEPLRLYVYDPRQYTQEINVLVIATTGPLETPRFVIRQPDASGVPVVVAAAGVNWQTPRFAGISVETAPAYRDRGYGQAVVNALAARLLADGRTPLYLVGEQNRASIQLAEHAGFADTGARQMLLEAALRPFSVV